MLERDFTCEEDSLVLMSIDSEPNHSQILVLLRDDSDWVTRRDDESVAR